MRKFWLVFGLVFASIALGAAAAEEYDGNWTGRTRILRQPKTFSQRETPMHKALFTQRGYIQFLRWELPVPEIEEFTFCLWVKSTNFTYSHSIFSYSKNEKQRLISSWISPFGRSVHLEIGEIEIISHPTNLHEHRWYHICQSWENRIGRYALWINGWKEVEGYAAQLTGHVIPSMGDIVVGQEYTNFDKGLEDGVEGAVLGFNLILASAFDESRNTIYPTTGHDVQDLLSLLSLGESRIPSGFGATRTAFRTAPHLGLGVEVHPGIDLRRSVGNDPRFLTRARYRGESERFWQRTRRDARGIARLRRDGGGRPLGLQLVDLTYNYCWLGRGSPFIGGSKMLISWSRTPVKVFGGAIIKNAGSTCGNF